MIRRLKNEIDGEIMSLYGGNSAHDTSEFLQDNHFSERADSNFIPGPSLYMVPLNLYMVPLYLYMVPLYLYMVPLNLYMVPLYLYMVPLYQYMVALYLYGFSFLLTQNFGVIEGIFKMSS